MNKRAAAFGVLLLGSFFILAKSFAANTDIVINEIGAYENNDGYEWIEIWNKGDGGNGNDIDLSNWYFWQEGMQYGHEITATGTQDSVVSRGEYAVIVENAEKFLSKYPSMEGSIFESDGWNDLVMSGKYIGLKDGYIKGDCAATSTFCVESFKYISAPNFSLQRRNSNLANYTSANWAEYAGGNTVGAPNIFTTGTTSTPPPQGEETTVLSQSNGGSQIIQESPVQNLMPIKINEFVVDPEVENEWVELYNTGSENLDLSGSMICDSRNTTSTCKKVSGSIGPDKWLFVDLLTRSFLNNGGDSVIFKDPVGNVIDRIDYVDELIPDEGQSLARKADGVDTDSESNWVITDNPTPAAANVILDDTPVFNSSTPAKKTVLSKEKFIGLKWKIKYDLRLRQYEETYFSASSTFDPRGGRIAYSWNFGDQIISGVNVKYSFATSGTHVVIARATSTAGTVDEKKITIMVYPATETVGSGIIFSEVLPYAGGNEEEYIKLKNISGSAVNMSNWTLVYKNDVYKIPSSTFLAANDYLTFYQTVTGFTLNNTGGDLLLLNQDNILLDEVEYEKSEAGAAYIFNNEKWNWEMPATSAKVLGIKIVATDKKSAGRFYTTIADARGGQKGDYARIKGVVAVLPGVFGSQYFYLTDGGAGIQIYQSKKDFPPLVVGDSAQIYGAISEANGIKRINIKSKDDIDILAIDNVVSSTQLNADEIDESLAGGLVQVEGEITEIKSNFMYLDNGSGEAVVYFKQGAKIDKTKFKEGENARVTGILEQTKTGWQIWPRANDDIESLGPSEDLLKKQAATSGTDTKEKYLTATAGGVTTLILGFLLRARGLVVLGGIKKIFQKDKS